MKFHETVACSNRYPIYDNHYSLYNTIETSYDVLDNVVDLNQIFDVVKAAKESTQIWLIVKTSRVSNQSLAVAISALAQTKVNIRTSK